MQKYCRVLGSVVLVLGTIGSFIIAYYFGRTTEISYYTGKTIAERNWPMTIGYFAGCFIGVLVLAFILLGISEILDRLEDLQYNASIASSSSNDRALQYGEWRCPKCGKINSSIVGTCACGESKPA